MKLTFGKAGLAKPTRKCDEVEPELGHHEKQRHPSAEGNQPRPQRSILRGVLGANSGLTVQTPGGSKCKIQQVLTPGGSTRSTATRVLPHDNQEDDGSDEDEDIAEDVIDGDQVDVEVGEELGYIESEKRRRRMKRMEEEEKQDEESKLKKDAFWYSGPTTLSPPPTVQTNYMNKLDAGKVGLVEDEEQRQELLEECLDCFRGWVHECLEDVFRDRL